MCPLCSRTMRYGYSMEWCADCGGHFCTKHVEFVPEGKAGVWVCRRCKRTRDKRAAIEAERAQ